MIIMTSQFKITESCIRPYEIVSVNSILVSDDIIDFIKDHTINGSVPQSVYQTLVLVCSDRSKVSQQKYQSLRVTDGEWERADLLPLRLKKSVLDPGKYVIIDGRHRYMAYILEGFDEVPAFVV